MKRKKNARLAAVEAALVLAETVMLGIRGLKHACCPYSWSVAVEGSRRFHQIDPTPLRVGEQLAFLGLKEAIEGAMKGSCRHWKEWRITPALVAFKSRVEGTAETFRRELLLEQMPRSAREAYKGYRIAVESVGPGIRDRDAWDWLASHCPPGYRLPDFDTWARYLREARRLLGEQKNSPRDGRSGRSTTGPDKC